MLWNVLAIVAALVLLIICSLLGPILNLYIQAMLAGTKLSLLEMLAMRWRRADLRAIVFSRIRLHRIGMLVSPERMESHMKAGGRIHSVVSALIAARAAGLDLDWDSACSIDLEGGHDVVHAVSTLVETGEPEYIPAQDNATAHGR